MTDNDYLLALKAGASAWNRWRQEHPEMTPSLRGLNFRSLGLPRQKFKLEDFSHAAHSRVVSHPEILIQLDVEDLRRADFSNLDMESADLRGACLTGADLRGACLNRANLNMAALSGADLTGAQLEGADLCMANLRHANLAGADLRGVELSGADLYAADLSGADFSNARLGGTDLRLANFVNANLEDAHLGDCWIYGISAWAVNTRGAKQDRLLITAAGEPAITVDNLEVAQFIYLLVNNEKIRHVIDSITTKVVLILGRFTDARKAVLDAIWDELRKRGYLPVLFDFAKPINRDITETISTLAHLARFVIADITDARSIPQELSHIVPNLPSVPIQPLIHSSTTEYGMFEHFARFPWVLKTVPYHSIPEVVASIEDKVIEPAEAKARELQRPPSGR